MKTTKDLNIDSYTSLISPKELHDIYRLSDDSKVFVEQTRQDIADILENKSQKKLLIIGPCSIHDEKATLEYAKKLAELQKKVKSKFLILMRTYFEKPRTTTGWKGLINDPAIDNSFDVESGLKKARSLLLQITSFGLGCATEFLDPLTPQYLDDIISWAAIGARTVESQTHRQMASGLSMPVGLKNATNGDVELAMHALESANAPHSFIGIDNDGRSALIKTKGNKHAHIILRGGKGIKHIGEKFIQKVITTLKEKDWQSKIIVDCSHANAEKKHENQPLVFKEVFAQNNPDVIGYMLESNLFEGNQKISKDLEYGVSITDACISWETTEELVLWGFAAF